MMNKATKCGLMTLVVVLIVALVFGGLASAASDDYKIYTMNIGTGSTYSDPASITYADDASELTKAERTALLREHCKHAVVNYVDGSPQVVYWLYKDDLNYRATDSTCSVSSGVTSDLTGADGDVMLLYDPVWWTVSKANDILTISFSWDGKFSDDCVTPHLYGTSTADAKTMGYVGIGVFEATVYDSQLRSVNVSSTPEHSHTNEEFHTYAVTNRNNMYNQMLPLTYSWYAMTLLFESGSRNSQASYGYGLTKAKLSNVNTDWSATSAWKSATVYTDRAHGVTAGGIQNGWGHVWKFLGEFLKDTSNVAHFSVLGGGDHASIEGSTIPSTWATANMPVSSTGNFIDVTGDSNMPFIASKSGGSASSNWADYFYQKSDLDCGLIGGGYVEGTNCGVFCLNTDSPVAHYMLVGTRLQVMIPGYTITNASSDPIKGSTTVNKASGTAATLDLIKAEAVANSGYHFVNWTCINLSSTDVTENPYVFTMPAMNVSLTANFAANVTTVTYQNETGVTYDTKVYIFNESASLPDNPVKEEYRFNGWNITVGGIEYAFSGNSTYFNDGKWVYPCANNTNLIVNASWVSLYNTIDNTTVLNGTVIANKSRAIEGETVHVDAFNTTLGYHFNDWNVTNSTGKIVVDVSGNFTMPDSAVIAGANFTANVTTVHFYNGTNSEDKPNTFGSATVKPADPVKEGYTFVGWNVSVEGSWYYFNSDSYNKSGIWNYTGVHDGTLDVYANWTINTSVVSIVTLENGSVNAVPNGSVSYGTSVTLTNISKIGYHFVQYDIYKTGSTEEKVENSSNQFSMPGYAVNVSGIFAGNVTNVEFHNGSTSVGTKLNTYHAVTNATPILAPYPGYAFMGWNVSDGENWVDFNSTGFNNSGIWNYTGIDGGPLNVYANWSKLFYAIRYHANNGTGAYVDKTGVPYYTDVKLNSSTELGLSQAGLVFVNWTQYANGTGASYAEQAVVNNLAGTGTSTDLYAVWQTNKTALNSSEEVTIGGKTYTQWNASANSPYVVGYDMFNGTAVFGPFVIESPNAAHPLNYTLTKQNLSDSQTNGRINVTYRDGYGIFNELTWSSEYSFEDHDGNGYINLTELGRSKTGLSNVSVVVKEYPLGDANINNQVDIIDSAVVGIYVLKGGGDDVSGAANIFLPDENKVHGDVNHDGLVDVADMLKINQYLVGYSVLG